MEQVKSEETQKFLLIVDKNKGIIYKVANLYCRNHEDRNDLIQEIILQLWLSFSKYDEQFKLSTWIYRIALNVSISFYRKEKRRGDISLPISEDILIFDDENSKSEINSDLGLLQKFISELKELDRALMLLYLEEKTHKEIAELLGLSETNVATKLNRIKNILKQRFLTINK